MPYRREGRDVENFFHQAMKNINLNSQTPIFRHPFFQKTVFFSKIFFGKAPSKFLNSESMWKWTPVYNINSARALKNYFPTVSKLPPLCQTPTHRRIYYCKCFHSPMPNFDTVLLNKQNWCKSKHELWAPHHNFSPCKRKA